MATTRRESLGNSLAVGTMSLVSHLDPTPRLRCGVSESDVLAFTNVTVIDAAGRPAFTCAVDWRRAISPIHRRRYKTLDFAGMSARATLISVTMLALDRPDARLIFLEGIQMHHPVEDHGKEPATGCIAGFLSVD